MVQVARTAEGLSDPDLDALDMVEVFLHVAELSVCLGNPKLPLPVHEPTPSMWAKQDETELLAKVLKLFIRVERSHAATYDGPEWPCWHRVSSFYELQAEIDTLLLQNPDVFRPTRQTLRQWIEDGWVEHMHAVLLWHSCNIVLNRPFLPIRLHPSSPGLPPQGPEVAYCNKAPKHFSKERINLCLGSAIAIPTICEEILASESYLPVCQQLDRTSIQC